MELKKLREEIDQIDSQLVALLSKRMEVCASIADYKRVHGLPVHDPAREEAKLAQITGQAGEELGSYTAELYKTIFALSRDYQNRRNGNS